MLEEENTIFCIEDNCICNKIIHIRSQQTLHKKSMTNYYTLLETTLYKIFLLQHYDLFSLQLESRPVITLSPPRQLEMRGRGNFWQPQYWERLYSNLVSRVQGHSIISKAKHNPVQMPREVLMRNTVSRQRRLLALRI